MRNYWIKILLGALGIFAVGMLLVTGFRAKMSLNGSGPIEIPLIGLIPFRVDSAKLGSVSKVEFLRSDPKHVSGVRVVVRLADSIDVGRLHDCVLALQSLDNIDEKTTFRCQSAAEGPGNLESFGSVVVGRQGGADTLALLLPRKVVAAMRGTAIHINGHGIQVNGPHDTVAEAFAAQTDSIHELLNSRIDARSDSVDELKDLASSLEDSAADLSAPARRRVQHAGDSVRAVMRAMIDRMQTDQARMEALDRVVSLSAEQRDSLAMLGSMLGKTIADSMERNLARELGQLHAELARTLPEAAREVPPAPGAIPAPASPRPPRRPPKAAAPVVKVN